MKQALSLSRLVVRGRDELRQALREISRLRNCNLRLSHKNSSSGPDMQTSSIRQICRSSNAFTPSIALRQYFIPSTPAVRSCQRLLSSTSQIVESNKPEPVENESSRSFTRGAEQDVAPSPKTTNLRTPTLRDAYNKQVPSRTPARPRRKKPRVTRPRSSSLGPKQNYTSLKAQDAIHNLEDYTGVVVEPASFAPAQPGAMVQETNDTNLPWCLHHDGPSLRGHERYLLRTHYKLGWDTYWSNRLSSEIDKFYDYATPSRSESLARRHLVKQIQSHTREISPNIMLEVFGSEKTGLSLATSDIDLRLVTPEIAAETKGSLRHPSKKQRNELFDYLYKLEGLLNMKKNYILCVIRYSRYPLISLQDRASGVDVQIVLSNDSTASEAAASKYLKEYPYLAKVYTVVKSMFDIRGLSDVFRGGFGGYPLFMMVVASLQLNPPAKADAAHGLLSFLDFWGTFDTAQNGISIDPPELLTKDETIVKRDETKALFEVCLLLEIKFFQLTIFQKGKLKQKPLFLLTLRDPADPTNDIGAKGVCIRHVQATCRHLFQLLQRSLDAPGVENLLKPVVGPVFDINMRRRAKLAEQGQHVLEQVQVSLAAKARQLRESEKKSATDRASE